jgi:hypothetical protein
VDWQNFSEALDELSGLREFNNALVNQDRLKSSRIVTMTLEQLEVTLWTGLLQVRRLTTVYKFFNFNFVILLK